MLIFLPSIFFVTKFMTVNLHIVLVLQTSVTVALMVFTFLRAISKILL